MVCHSPEMCAQNANGELIILSLKLFHSIEQAKKDVVPLRYAHNGFTIKPPNSVQGSPGNHPQAYWYNWSPGPPREDIHPSPRDSEQKKEN